MSQSANMHGQPAVNGDSFAIDLRSLRPRLLTYARSIARDRDLADDLVQETMLRAWRTRARFQAGSNMRAWTFTILRNAFLNERRRAAFTVGYDDQDAERRLATPEQQSVWVHLADAARSLNRLPENQRAALLLVAVEGLAYEEAAAVAGISVNTVKRRVCARSRP